MLGKNLILSAAGNLATEEKDPYWNNVSFLFVADGAAGTNNSTFLDDSTNGSTVTRVGSVIQGSHIPYTVSGSYKKDTNKGSAYFPGSSSCLLGPSDSTTTWGSSASCHFWIKVLANNTAQALVSDGSATGIQLEIDSSMRLIVRINNTTFYRGTDNVTAPSGADVTAGVWTHITLYRRGGYFRLAKNGVVIMTIGTGATYSWVATYSLTSPFRIIGAYNTAGNTRPYRGYMAGFYFSPTVSLPFGFPITGPFTIPTTPPSSSNGLLLNFANAACWDAKMDKTFQPLNGVVASTSSKFGDSSSMYFTRNGSANRIVKPNDCGSLGIGTQDFTLEAWVYPYDRRYMAIYSTMGGGTGSSTGFVYTPDESRGAFIYYAGNYQTPGWEAYLSANSWNHMVVCRTSGTYRTYLNGTFRESGGGANNNTNNTLDIGWWFGDYNTYGLINSMRLTNGISRYTGSSYTVPTTPFPRRG